MSRSRLLLVVKVLVSVGLLGWVGWTALSRTGVDELTARLEGLHPGWLLVAVVIQMAAIGVGVWRWRSLLAAQGIALPFHSLSKSYLVGRFVGSFTPSTVGLDAYRVIDVARRTGRRGASTSVILVEKCVGLLGLSVCCVLLLPFGAEQHLGPTAPLLALLIALGAGLGLWVLARPEAVTRLVTLLPSRVANKLTRPLRAIGARGLNPTLLTGTVALSALGHLLTASVFVAAALALRIEVAPGAVLVVGVAIVLAMLLPISVAGIGVREGVAVVLLGSLGVAVGDATLVGLLGYLTAQIPSVFGGLLLLKPSSAPLGEPALAASPPGQG